jgi:hypothetical protein
VKTAPKDSAPQLSKMAQMVIDSVSRAQNGVKDSSKMVTPKKVLKQAAKKPKPAPAKSPKSKEVDDFEKVFGTEK